MIHNPVTILQDIWGPGMVRENVPAIGATRPCPDCGRPQHYTGTENGWAHDALIATWECNDPQKASHPPEAMTADQPAESRPQLPMLATYCTGCDSGDHDPAECSYNPANHDHEECT